METDQLILEKVRTLSPEKQQKVLDFVESLQRKTRRKRPYRSLYGLWAEAGVDISEEDIAEARREMWGSFPREDI